MKIETLEDLLVHELKDLHSAETQITKALPEMARQAKNAELRRAFESHLKETEGQLERLEKISDLVGKKLTGHTCKAMQGLVAEAKELIKEDAPAEVQDAGLIGAAQRVEHYEMAGYGTARALAEQLGHADIVKLLEQTLQEEKNADQKLTRIAVNRVNEAAAS